MKVGIVGAGPWGRALAELCDEAGNDAMLGFRGQVPPPVDSTPDLARLAGFADLILLAVPARDVRAALQALAPGPGHRVVLCARGPEPGSGAWLTDIVQEETACLRVGVLGGPANPVQLARGEPGALIVASPFVDVQQRTQTALHSPRLRVYPSFDLRGVELAGSLVQSLAAAVGMAEGMGLGPSVRGVLISRGLAECARLMQAVGADPSTLSGLAGVGELVSLTSDPAHPAFATGAALGRGEGEPLSAVVVAAVDEVLGRARSKGVDMPLLRAVQAVSEGRIDPAQAMQALMEREATATER